MTEGETTFDIRFVAYAPTTGELIKLIINLEAQKKSNPGYSLVKRAMFHCSRLISSQYNVEFVEPNFDDIKKVISIWIVMNSPIKSSNCITQYRIVKFRCVIRCDAVRFLFAQPFFDSLKSVEDSASDFNVR